MITGISEKLEISWGGEGPGALLLVWRANLQETFLLAHGAQLSVGRREGSFCAVGILPLERDG